MVHENSDDGSLCRTPLGLRPGEPLSGLMTLQNFVDGGCDVADAKVVVVVKSVGAKKSGTMTLQVKQHGAYTDHLSVARKDGTANENVVVHIQDDTSEAALGLYGSATCSPFQHCTTDDHTIPDAVTADRAWKAGETILLLHAPNCKPTKVVCLGHHPSSIPLWLACHNVDSRNSLTSASPLAQSSMLIPTCRMLHGYAPGPFANVLARPSIQRSPKVSSTTK